MKPAVLLGLRLATSARGQRARSVATVGAAALGTAVLLLVWGMAHSRLATSTAFRPQEVSLLIAGIIGMVALPVLVLISTVSRLSAGLRDRRLANLRLLGMSAVQTRVVAAVEVGAASVLGAGLGVVLFVVAASGMALTGVGGRQWSTASLMPPAVAWVTVLVLVLGVSALTVTVPPQVSARRALERARHTVDHGPGYWRVVPLCLGAALCWSTRSPLTDRSSDLPMVEVVVILVGIALLGIGTLLVVPVFVGLLARVLLGLGRGPLAMLTGRRLQAQPTGATRVISALMLGLFVVMSSRAVVSAFVGTDQYERAADFIEREQTAEVTATPARHAAATTALAAIDGVERVASYPVLHGRDAEAGTGEADEATVVVATCAELAYPDESLAGCDEDAVSLVGEPWFFADDVEALDVRAIRGYQPRGDRVVVPLTGASVIAPEAFQQSVGALSGTPTVVVPPGTPGIEALLPATSTLLVAHAGPGRHLYDHVEDAGLTVDSYVDLENYDFVQGMRTMVWLLAAVVLSIGLLTFTVAGVDRAMSRRRELTALRLIGTPGSLLRRAQWLEAALPTVLGSVLAIFTGGYAGATYLQLDADQVTPLSAEVTLAAVAVVTSMLLAGITVLGTTARLDPQHIRAE